MVFTNTALLIDAKCCTIVDQLFCKIGIIILFAHIYNKINAYTMYLYKNHIYRDCTFN